MESETNVPVNVFGVKPDLNSLFYYMVQNSHSLTMDGYFFQQQPFEFSKKGM